MSRAFICRPAFPLRGWLPDTARSVTGAAFIDNIDIREENKGKALLYIWGESKIGRAHV